MKSNNPHLNVASGVLSFFPSSSHFASTSHHFSYSECSHSAQGVPPCLEDSFRLLEAPGLMLAEHYLLAVLGVAGMNVRLSIPLQSSHLKCPPPRHQLPLPSQVLFFFPLFPQSYAQLPVFHLLPLLQQMILGTHPLHQFKNLRKVSLSPFLLLSTHRRCLVRSQSVYFSFETYLSAFITVE